MSRIQVIIECDTGDSSIMEFKTSGPFLPTLFQEMMEKAIIDFIETPEGKKIIEENNGTFNYGDAAIHVPDEFWQSRGLTRIYQTSNYIYVDHDQNFAE